MTTNMTTNAAELLKRAGYTYDTMAGAWWYGASYTYTTAEALARIAGIIPDPERRS